MPLVEQASPFPSIDLHFQSPLPSLELAPQIPSPSPQVEPTLALVQIPQKSNKSNNSKGKATLSQILCILKFEVPKSKKKTSASNPHGRLVTSSTYVFELIVEKQRKAAIIQAQENERNANKEESEKKKRDRDCKQVDGWMKKWITTAEKKMEREKKENKI